ncbi:MAG: 3-oxoacyl-[acyl-carrier-protein] synthase II [Myxococcota bacterium]|jgi:3-oxoacyl-[acyl-carrier-protein] synthase II
MVAIPGQTVGLAASLFKVRGPTYTFTSTCSSGAVAIGHAMREIQSGELDLALATGHEASLVAPLFAMYRDAGLISAEQEDARRAVMPYIGHSANAFGEGAVTLVLEDREYAERRGANILGVMAGYSYGNNGHHPTAIDILGLRPAEVIERMLDRADVVRDDVSFVVGHGNGVRRSDVSEENYMRRLFGRKAAEVPLISIKPIYGHNLGASSAMNAAAAIMMVHHDYVVPTINIDASAGRRVTEHQAREGTARPCGVGVAMSYGMGGQNAALLVKKAEAVCEDRLAG